MGLDFVGQFFDTVVAGGATGIIGTVVSGIFNQKKAKTDNDHEIEMRRLDIEEAKIEGDTALQKTALETDARALEADSAGMLASIKEASTRWTEGANLSGPQLWLLLIVDVIRGLTRPGLTFLSFWALWEVGIRLAPPPATPVNMMDLWIQVVNALIYISTTSSLWWFGARQIAQPRGRRG